MSEELRMCSIASGSSGNCTYIGNTRTHLLVDAGISCKRIEEGLAQLSLAGRDLNGILVTHEHSDHIGGLGVLARRYKLPLYMTGGTADAIRRSGSIGQVEAGLFHEILEDESFVIGDLTVQAFTIPHDAAQPVGYRVGCGKKAVGVATDLGRSSDYLVENLSGLDALLLEANHDLNMLQVGRYPYRLKLRIMGDRGHLSNENAGRMLARLLHDHLKHVLLGHLSKDNNYEALAYETVCQEIDAAPCPYRAADFDIQVAHRAGMSRLLTV